jgi:hypothetical protein
MSEMRLSNAVRRVGKLRGTPFPFAPIRQVRYNLSMIATHHDQSRGNHSFPKTGALPARP